MSDRVDPSRRANLVPCFERRLGMRDLDSINSAFLTQKQILYVSAFLLFAMSSLGFPLAYGVAPNVPAVKNPIVLLVFAGMGSSIILAMGASFLRFGWRAEFYGMSFLCFASVSFLGVVPVFAVVLYGGAPYSVKAIIILIYGATHWLWCRRFLILYEQVFGDEDLRRVVYEEDADAIYCIRAGEKFILNKYYKFSQMPRDRYFAGSVCVGILMIPIMKPVCAFIGAPFVHIFLIITALPISCMSLGCALRGFLIFYLYPAKLKRTTGKNVYVDLISKHRPLGKRLRRPVRSKVAASSKSVF